MNFEIFNESNSHQLSKYLEENIKTKKLFIEDNELNQKFIQENTIKNKISNGNSQQNKTNSNINFYLNRSADQQSIITMYTPSINKSKKKEKLNLFLNRSLLSMKTIEKIIHCNFLNEYVNDKDFYNIRMIDAIIHNEPNHVVAEFKDYLINGDLSEFLQTYYKLEDSKIILPKILEYYITCSVIFPNYVILPESKYIYKNIQRKQRVIDEQQEKEDKEEYLKNNKNKIEEKKIDNVFNTQAFDSILNQTDTSGIKNFFGIPEDTISDVNEEFVNVINEINKGERKKSVSKKNKRNRNLNKNDKLEQYLSNKSKKIFNCEKLQLNLNIGVNNGGYYPKLHINKTNEKAKKFKGKITDNKKLVLNNINNNNNNLEENVFNTVVNTNNNIKNGLENNKNLILNKHNKIPNQKPWITTNNINTNNTQTNTNNNNYSFKKSDINAIQDNDNIIENYKKFAEIKVLCQNAQNNLNSSCFRGRNFQWCEENNNTENIVNTYKKYMKDNDILDDSSKIKNKDYLTTRGRPIEIKNDLNIVEYSNKTDRLNKVIFNKIKNNKSKKNCNSVKDYNETFFSSKKKIEIKKSLISSLLAHAKKGVNTSRDRECSIKDTLNNQTNSNYYTKDKLQQSIKSKIIPNRINNSSIKDNSINKIINIRNRKILSDINSSDNKFYISNNAQSLKNISLIHYRKNEINKDSNLFNSNLIKSSHKNIINHKKKIIPQIFEKKNTSKEKNNQVTHKIDKDYSNLKHKFINRNSNGFLRKTVSKTNYKDENTFNTNNKNEEITAPITSRQYNDENRSSNKIEIKKVNQFKKIDKLRNKGIPKTSNTNDDKKIKIIKIDKNNNSDIYNALSASRPKIKNKINYDVVDILSSKIQKIKQRIKETSEKESISYIFKKKKIKDKNDSSPPKMKKNNFEEKSRTRNGNNEEFNGNNNLYKSKVISPPKNLYNNEYLTQRIIDKNPFARHIRYNSNFNESNLITKKSKDNGLISNSEISNKKIMKYIKKPSQRNGSNKLKYSTSQKVIISNQGKENNNKTKIICKGIPINGFDKIFSVKNLCIKENNPISELNREREELMDEQTEYNKTQRYNISDNFNKFQSGIYNKKINVNKIKKNK